MTNDLFDISELAHHGPEKTCLLLLLLRLVLFLI